jgi:hypothetical protein
MPSADNVVELAERTRKESDCRCWRSRLLTFSWWDRRAERHHEPSGPSSAMRSRRTARYSSRCTTAIGDQWSVSSTTRPGRALHPSKRLQLSKTAGCFGRAVPLQPWGPWAVPTLTCRRRRRVGCRNHIATAALSCLRRRATQAVTASQCACAAMTIQQKKTYGPSEGGATDDLEQRRRTPMVGARSATLSGPQQASTIPTRQVPGRSERDEIPLALTIGGGGHVDADH